MASAQERADKAAGELAAAVAELAGPHDCEIAAILRVTQDEVTVKDGLADARVLWTWDWFMRPKDSKPQDLTG